MAGTFQLEIATPERLLLREDVAEAQIPAASGYLGILPEHAPLLAEIGIGELTFTVQGRTQRLAVSGGWVEVLEGHVRVLVDSAELPADIDVGRALAALKRAEERLGKPDPGIDAGRALNAMKRAQARLAVAAAK